MINFIFTFFLLGGIVYSFFTGNALSVNESLIQSGEVAISMVLKIIPLLCLWLGVMKIASLSGLLSRLSLLFSKIIGPLFPELEKGDEALTYIATNIVMNIFGLGNAATPFGLKAFQLLQERNPKKEEASRSMITLLVMNTASVTLIPTTVISFRRLYHSTHPTEILIPCMIATILSCLLGLIVDRIFAKFWK